MSENITSDDMLSADSNFSEDSEGHEISTSLKIHIDKKVEADIHWKEDTDDLVLQFSIARDELSKRPLHPLNRINEDLWVRTIAEELNNIVPKDIRVNIILPDPQLGVFEHTFIAVGLKSCWHITSDVIWSTVKKTTKRLNEEVLK